MESSCLSPFQYPYGILLARRQSCISIHLQEPEEPLPTPHKMLENDLFGSVRCGACILGNMKSP